jgi:hypothetical protein
LVKKGEPVSEKKKEKKRKGMARKYDILNKDLKDSLR